MSDKQPKPVSDDLAKRLIGNLVRSGFLGMYGKGFETLPWNDEEKEDDTTVDLFKKGLQSAGKLVDPPSLRDLVAIGKAADAWQKTGKPSSFVDEFLRTTVVMYNRIAKRGDDDFNAVKLQRQKMKKDLEKRGFTDGDVEKYLNIVMPMPPARLSTDAYKAKYRRRTELAQEFAAMEEFDVADDIVGRLPKKTADLPDKRQPVFPSNTIKGKITEDVKKFRRKKQ